ncbi:putative chromosome segregation protein [Phaeomoniella chlamydospora]|uniref:Putative chromosome segregation protein n=1 Tax=Phaeomoniella chlamydospora TaxID=158046 RepID=A0A0G2DS19_PHACM|nr:putative chromosome segregation protein [Phaeomoniella chlamydospora]
MAAQSSTLPTLAQLLEASLDPRTNKQAELSLRAEEKKPGFSILLLQIAATESYPYNTRLSSALCFKNLIKRNWTDEEGNYKLPEQDVGPLKAELVGLMVSVPAGIQTQLGEAISIIAKSDYYERWDTLVDDLVSRLTPDNIKVNIGVLQVAHSVFSTWRPLFRSDELFTEINYTLKKFCGPYLVALQNIDSYIEGHASDKQALQQAFTELDLLLQLFYDLSCQDLPPQFEDSIQQLASLLHKYLVYDNPLLHTDSDDDAGVLENVKATIFDALVLYVQKYYDAFGTSAAQFIGSSWNLLTTINSDVKNDILVSKALHFLTAISKVRSEAEAFNNESTLGQVVEKVILPNVTLRDSDVEMFEDEPIEFIRRDLEGSDSETRRRAATDFLRQLMDHFELLVTKIVLGYVERFLEAYNSDKSNWRSKDTAVYLFNSVAAKGVATASQGVTQINPSVDIGDFFQKHLANDLFTGDAEALLKVDAIKFLYIFRSLIDAPQWQQIMPLLVNHLGNSNYVVYTYAAIVVERILYLTGDNGRPIIDPSAIMPLAKDLVEHIFSLIEKDSAPQKVQENEFLMRCVMRVLIVIKEGLSPLTDILLSHLIKITNIIIANPSNPRFYYYHFESIGALIRFSDASQASKIQQELFQPFVTVLQNNVDEFIPYVFQLFAALLENNASGGLPPAYQSLITPILAPPVWEQRGNVPALVRLLSAIIPLASTEMQNSNQIEHVLGIFQKLVSAKSTESQAFDLLETVIECFPASALQPYWTPIFQVLFTRLQNSRTQTFDFRFVRLYHFISARDTWGINGTDFYISITDAVQQDIFRGVYLSIVLPESQKIVRSLDKKTACVSFTKLLGDSEAFVTRYPKGWPHSCNALLKLLEEAPAPTKADDIIADYDVEDMGFGVGFTQLQTIKKALADPFPDVVDLRKWVGGYLQDADKRHGGRVAKFVQESLSDDAKKVLMAYMTL